LAAVVFAFHCEETIVTCSHGGERVADKIGLGVVVGVGEDMCDCDGVCCHETTATDEAAVDERAAVRVLPACHEVVVLLVVHLCEVAHEEGGRGGAWEVAERGRALTE
jgi:hypothetical protein